MKEFIVIDKQGNLHKPKEYLKLPGCGRDFAIVIKREVLGLKARSAEKDYSYSNYAKKYGFDWEPNSPAGFMRFDYKAELIMSLIKKYASNVVQEVGIPIYKVSGSNMFDLRYPVVKSYAGLYGDRLFKSKAGKKEIIMSYDASYPQFNLANKYNISHKNLPFAHFSISDCYRNEQHGECMLFYRIRRFFMPDLHPYCKDIKEAFCLYPKIERVIHKVAHEVKKEYQVIAEVSSLANWKQYKEEIINIAKEAKQEVLVSINLDNKDRYWIINVDYNIIDSFGQVREIACIQIDVGNAKRMNIKYRDANQELRNPIIIHSAVSGSIERYLYMLFDNFENCFPLWLKPIHLRLIPVSKKYIPQCMKLVERFSSSPVRIDIDDSNESVGKRIKIAKEALIPFPFVVGEKELEQKNGCKSLNEIVSKIAEGNDGKPFLNISWPCLVSKQLQ